MDQRLSSLCLDVRCGFKVSLPPKTVAARGRQCSQTRFYQPSRMSESRSPSSETSPTLLNRASAGDEQAWQRLVKLYGPLVFHWTRQQGLAEHDAADLLQDVFSSVARSLKRFERQKEGSFRSWLWVITRNQLTDFFRHRANEAQAAGGTAAWQQLARVAESLSDDPDDFTTPNQLNALHRRGLELVRCEFEERTWQIFWRSAIDDVDTKDVAEEFGITANAVRQAKSRVLRKLRHVLEVE